MISSSSSAPSAPNISPARGQRRPTISAGNTWPARPPAEERAEPSRSRGRPPIPFRDQIRVPPAPTSPTHHLPPRPSPPGQEKEEDDDDDDLEEDELLHLSSSSVDLWSSTPTSPEDTDDEDPASPPMMMNWSVRRRQVRAAWPGQRQPPQASSLPSTPISTSSIKAILTPPRPTSFSPSTLTTATNMMPKEFPRPPNDHQQQQAKQRSPASPPTTRHSSLSSLSLREPAALTQTHPLPDVNDDDDDDDDIEDENEDEYDAEAELFFHALASHESTLEEEDLPPPPQKDPIAVDSHHYPSPIVQEEEGKEEPGEEEQGGEEQGGEEQEEEPRKDQELLITPRASLGDKWPRAMEMACRNVHDLLEQLTMHDAPPVNELRPSATSTATPSSPLRRRGTRSTPHRRSQHPSSHQGQTPTSSLLPSVTLHMTTTTTGTSEESESSGSDPVPASSKDNVLRFIRSSTSTDPEMEMTGPLANPTWASSSTSPSSSSSSSQSYANVIPRDQQASPTATAAVNLSTQNGTTLQALIRSSSILAGTTDPTTITSSPRTQSYWVQQLYQHRIHQSQDPSLRTASPTMTLQQEHDPGRHWAQHVQVHLEHNPSAVLLGQTHLAAMCGWTLQHIQGVAVVNTAHTGSLVLTATETVPLSDRTPEQGVSAAGPTLHRPLDDQRDLHIQGSDQKSPGPSPVHCLTGRKGPWSTPGHPMALAKQEEGHLQSTEEGHWGEEKKDEDGDLNHRPDDERFGPPEEHVRPTLRLQLFGSEYARYLSHSDLAPTASSSLYASPFGRSLSSHRPLIRKRVVRSTQSTSLYLPQRPTPTPPSQGRLFHRSTKASGAAKPISTLDDAPPEVLSGALLDVVVTVGDDPPPTGYYRMASTATGLPFVLQSDLRGHFHGNSTKNSGGSKSLIPTRKKPLFLNIKKEPDWDKAAQRPCITALAVIYPDRKEFVPPGYCPVRRYHQSRVPPSQNMPLEGPADLNPAGQERVFLCMRRSREGNPITGLVLLAPAWQEAVPDGYTVLERTPRHFVADLSGGTGPPLFLAYRQRLANLETLRPLPLVLTVKDPTTHADDGTVLDGQQDSATLQAYYATGGTVVPSSVGRYHILDRSTHTLLSPSSISHRLRLIEASRRLSAAAGDSVVSTKPGDHPEDDTPQRTKSMDDQASVLSDPTVLDRSTSEVIGSSFMEAPQLTSDQASVSSVSQGHEEKKGEGRVVTFWNSLLQDAPDHDQVHHPAVIFLQEAGWNPYAAEAMSFIPRVDTAVADDERAEATLRLESRAALLTPVLTACYTQHGGGALCAVEGLTRLLVKTNFFQDDVDLTETGDNESSSRLTLLDLSIQVVCDVATAGSHEIAFATCIDFVEKAVRFAQGQLHTRTIGYVVRFYLFVYYFGICVQSENATTHWPSCAWKKPEALAKTDATNKDPNLIDMIDIPVLFEARTETSGYMPGGAPQAAALAFKELISLSIIRLGKVSVLDMVSSSRDAFDKDGQTSRSPARDDPYKDMLDSVISSLVEDSVELVERANYTQLALHQVHRSGGSELFWYDMLKACGQGLFAKDDTLSDAERNIYIMVFALLTNLVKVCSGKLRTHLSNGELLPRDIASKLLSFELLLHFLEIWSDEQQAVNELTLSSKGKTAKSIDTLAFVVRRTVVPCLLWNTRAGFESAPVFRRMIRIVSELWCSPLYRSKCKVELGVLMEHFGVGLLHLGAQLKTSSRMEGNNDSLYSQQLDLIREIKVWFSADPKDVIELYLNYDTDMSSEVTGPLQLIPGTKWMVFQRLCLGLCNIAEQCSDFIGDQIRKNQSFNRPQREAGRLGSLNKAEARDTARQLRKASLEAISQLVRSLAILSATHVGREFVSLLYSWDNVDESECGSSLFKCDSESETASKAKTNYSYEMIIEEAGEDEVLQFWRTVIASNEQPLKSMMVSTSTSQESMNTGLDIARTKSVKKAIEYLIACNVLTPAPRDVANFLRIHRDNLDPADLGNYLGENGLGPSEGEYWNSIRYIFIRAISFIGMHVEEGLRHLLTNSGFRLPGEAQKIDRLISVFAQCYFEDNAGDLLRCPFKSQDAVFLLSFAIIMLNTDLHRSSSGSASKVRKKMTKQEFINNLRGVDQGGEIPREYLSIIYDSIEAQPIVLSDEIGSPTNGSHRSVETILKNVRASDSVLRGLAVHDFRFATIDDLGAFANKSKRETVYELTGACVTKTWHQWHGVINTALEIAHLDAKGMEPALTILQYSLIATICLDMVTERKAFLGQLARLRAFEESRQGRLVSAANSFQKESWHVKLDVACSGPKEEKLWAILKVREWIQSLQSALIVDVENKVSMDKAASELHDSDFLLHDPARSFIRSGELTKKSIRTGRTAEYRFYLFSDVLLYASRDHSSRGERNKIHEALPLHLMKIVDWFPPTTKGREQMFAIHHPRKTLHVLCSSGDERRSWVNDIKRAIEEEMERKMTLEAARVAAFFPAAQR